MSYNKKHFGELFAEPSRNGVYKSADAHGSGCKIVNMGELFAYDFIGNQEMQRIQMTDAELEKSGLKENDLLFARRSLVEEGAGKSSIVLSLSEPLTFESSIIRVRLDSSKCYPLFYLYWLRSPNGRGAIRSLVNGTNVKGIRGSALKDIIVDYPELAIQKRVADILFSYDDLIENNQRQIKLLEEAAQRLYKEWFIDFRFPGHENVRIVDGVPEGWSHGTVSDVVKYYDTVRRPLSGQQREKMKGKYRYFGAAGILDHVNTYLFDGTYLLLGEDGTVITDKGFPVLQYVTGQFWVNNHAHVLTGRGSYSTEYIYMMFSHMRISDVVTGVAQPKISQGRLSTKKILIPAIKVVTTFNDFIKPIFDNVLRLEKQIAFLQEARDRLLPKLMSGEIEV